MDAPAKHHAGKSAMVLPDGARLLRKAQCAVRAASDCVDVIAYINTEIRTLAHHRRLPVDLPEPAQDNHHDDHHHHDDREYDPPTVGAKRLRHYHHDHHDHKRHRVDEDRAHYHDGYDTPDE